MKQLHQSGIIFYTFVINEVFIVVVRSGALRASCGRRTQQHWYMKLSGTNLCRGGEAGVGLGGADLQQVEVVAALVVERPGQAERAALLVDAEQIPRIHQQHVGQAFLLEGDSCNRGNTARTHTELDLCCCVTL